ATLPSTPSVQVRWRRALVAGSSSGAPAWKSLREFRALTIHRGGMFARNFSKARVTEPALDEKSFASLGMFPPRQFGICTKFRHLTRVRKRLIRLEVTLKILTRYPGLHCRPRSPLDLSL